MLHTSIVESLGKQGTKFTSTAEAEPMHILSLPAHGANRISQGVFSMTTMFLDALDTALSVKSALCPPNRSGPQRRSVVPMRYPILRRRPVHAILRAIHSRCRPIGLLRRAQTSKEHIWRLLYRMQDRHPHSCPVVHSEMAVPGRTATRKFRCYKPSR